MMWTYGTADELCNIEYGTRVVRKKQKGTKYPVYGGGGETFRVDMTNRRDRIIISRFAMSKRCTRFVKGDFFLNDSGLTVSPKSSDLSHEYLDKVILSLNNDIYSLGRGTAQRNLNMDGFRLLRFGFPSLAEQKHIAATLDEAFAAIAAATANTKENIANAQELFDSELNRVFQPPQSAEDSVSDVTAEWRETTLGEVCDVIAGQSPKGSNYNNQGNGLPFYQGKKEFGYKFIGAPTTWTTQITREAHAGDILMSVRAPVGPINFSTDRICIGRGIAAIRASNQINQEFLFYVLLSMQKQIQGTEGAVFASINKMQIENLMLCFPPLHEQKRIVAFLDKLSAEKQTLVETYKTKIRALVELKQSLLHQAFTGELTSK